jgi:hypothetical protein
MFLKNLHSANLPKDFGEDTEIGNWAVRTPKRGIGL